MDPITTAIPTAVSSMGVAVDSRHIMRRMEMCTSVRGIRGAVRGRRMEITWRMF